MNEEPKQITLNNAIEEFIDTICINWERLDRESWRKQMFKLMKGTFLEVDPVSVQKSQWYVLQNITSSFPPSMGEIIDCAKKIIASGKVRKVAHGECEKCNGGRRTAVFWLLETDTDRHVKHTGILSCDCEYGKAQKTRLNLTPIHTFVAKMQNHPRLINNRIWYQTKKDELPPLEIEKYDMENFRKFVPASSVSEFAKKHQKVLQLIKKAQEENVE